MRIIALSTLKQFRAAPSPHQDAREPALAWYRDVHDADWSSPAALKAQFRSASVHKDGRVVFNLAGNKYRLVAWINYPYRVVYIRFIGSHKQFDAIDAQTIWLKPLFGATPMHIKPIRTRTDYKAALQAVEALMGAKVRSPQGERLDVWVTLIEAYARQHFPMDLPDAVEVIQFRMEQQGLLPRDLAPMIGRSDRVYEVLARKRALTLPKIQKLHAMLGIPAESLLKPTALQG